MCSFAQDYRMLQLASTTQQQIPNTLQTNNMAEALH